VVTCVTGGVVTRSLRRTRSVSTPFVYVTRYVFVLTPRTPGVVTEVVPWARVELCTVVEPNAIREVSVTALVVTIGVGVGVGVGDVFGFAATVVLGVVAATTCAGASGNGWVAP
jgi:hypothetical protein